MLDLKWVKNVVISDGVHLSCVKQVLNLWATKNRIISQDWKDMSAAILEALLQLQWRTWWKEEVREIEQQNSTRGINISQDQLLKKGQYSMLERQFEFDDNNFVLCSLAVLNTWDNKDEERSWSHLLKL